MDNGWSPEEFGNCDWGGNNRTEEFGNCDWGGNNRTEEFGNCDWGGNNRTEEFGNRNWGGNNNHRSSAEFGNRNWGGNNNHRSSEEFGNRNWGGNNNHRSSEEVGNRNWGGNNSHRSSEEVGNRNWGGNNNHRSSEEVGNCDWGGNNRTEEFGNCDWGGNNRTEEFGNCDWGGNTNNNRSEQFGNRNSGNGTAQRRNANGGNNGGGPFRVPSPAPQQVPVPPPVTPLDFCCPGTEPSPPVRSNIVYVDGIEDYQHSLPLMRIEEIASVFFLHITNVSVLDVKRVLPSVHSNHFAIVELGTVQQAEKAISMLNGITLSTGHKLFVCFSTVPFSFVPSNHALLHLRAEKRRNDPRTVWEEQPVEGELFSANSNDTQRANMTSNWDNGEEDDDHFSSCSSGDEDELFSANSSDTRADDTTPNS
ncbi:hypothetical protein niasHT_029526 [Heterodera trifolii]|uniref:RRM domain-containing protein n=1 Tax=Heterodera trifolii TaxID=157864 RepID=A0ABD2JB15_9BILA